MAARRARPASTLDRVVDVALELAGETGWYDLPMRRLADRLGVTMADLARVARDPDAIADAFFARGRDAMLAVPRGGAGKSARDRIEGAMLRWFDALAPHRRVAGAMLRAKLHPSHLHHWVPLPFHLSRLVWWLREAAGLDATGVRRQAEEIALSALFVATLAVWLADESEGQERTRTFLARRLDEGARAMKVLFR